MNEYELKINEVIAENVMAGELDEDHLRNLIFDNALGSDGMLERQLEDYISNAIDLALRFKEGLWR